nr:MAG TPA: Bacterial DNA-binding protein [Bacteriophage sp.]
MTKTDLIFEVKKNLNVTEDKAREIIETVVETIKAGAAKDGKCVIPGLGKLAVTKVAERTYTAFGKSTTKPAHKKFTLEFADETYSYLNK